MRSSVEFKACQVPYLLHWEFLEVSCAFLIVFLPCLVNTVCSSCIFVSYFWMWKASSISKSFEFSWSCLWLWSGVSLDHITAENWNYWSSSFLLLHLYAVASFKGFLRHIFYPVVDIGKFINSYSFTFWSMIFWSFTISFSDFWIDANILSIFRQTLKFGFLWAFLCFPS